MAPTANEKREIVKGQLRDLRKNLRTMHAGVTEEHVMPDPKDVKTVMGQLESLLEVIDPKGTKKKAAKKTKPKAK